MLDWDYDIENLGRGYLTLYLPLYGDNANDKIKSFNLREMSILIATIKKNIERIKERTKKEFLVGLNSDSFVNKRPWRPRHENYHNLFLEWDKEQGLPKLDKLKELEGVITETKNGYHFVKEDHLTLEALIAKQEEWKCCKGFTNFTGTKEHSCLRICPKPDSYIKIIDYHDSLVHNIYKELIVNLGGEYVAT